MLCFSILMTILTISLLSSPLPLSANIDGTTVKVEYKDTGATNPEIIDTTDPMDPNPPKGNPINLKVMTGELDGALVDDNIDNLRWAIDIGNEKVNIVPLKTDYANSMIEIIISNMTWGTKKGKITGISFNSTPSGITDTSGGFTKDSLTIKYKAGASVGSELIKVEYTVVHVPEPSTYLALGSLLVLSTLLMKKRIRKLKPS